MDQTVLVENGQKLIDLMDGTDIKPRAALWVHNTDTNTWRLWIVPDRKMLDRREFYRTAVEFISANRGEFSSLEANDIEMIGKTSGNSGAIWSLSHARWKCSYIWNETE